MAWLGVVLHPAWAPLQYLASITEDEAGYGGVRRKGVELLRRHGEYLEHELGDQTWCLGERYSVADIYLYMLVGWRSYAHDFALGGQAVEAHYERVGIRPAIARARELDDLDERLQRHHPELRAGRPI